MALPSPLASSSISGHLRSLSNYSGGAGDGDRRSSDLAFARLETPGLVPEVPELQDAAALATSPYALPVDRAQFDRATEIQPLSLLRPHMRIFHISWITAIPGFLGWYAIPPLMPVLKDQLGLSKGDILNSDIASTASTILSRVALGPLLEMYGPQHVHAWTLWLGAIPVALAAFVQSAAGLIVVRFFIGLVGCIFVSNQFWTTITFAKNVVGTGNAIAGGLGLSGIGYAFLILPYLNEALRHGLSDDLAWRVAIALPAVVMAVMGFVALHRADGCPLGKFYLQRRAQNELNGLPHNDHPRLMDVLPDFARTFRVVLGDPNTYVLMLHYGVSFGAELQLNNMGALYFYEEFRRPECPNTDDESCHVLSKSHAATLAATFGLMNMFARALGGLASDFANRRLGMRGRLAVHAALLCLLGAMVLTLSRMTRLGPSIAVYIAVAIAAQAAGGSGFGIVPYVNEAYTGTVTGLVGAGGNMGGVLFGIIFRCTASRADGLRYMGIIILVSALFTAALRFGHDKSTRR